MTSPPCIQVCLRENCSVSCIFGFLVRIVTRLLRIFNTVADHLTDSQISRHLNWSVMTNLWHFSHLLASFLRVHVGWQKAQLVDSISHRQFLSSLRSTRSQLSMWLVFVSSLIEVIRHVYQTWNILPLFYFNGLSSVNLMRLEQKPHLTVVWPRLAEHSYVSAFSALICLWLGEQSCTQTKTGHWHNDTTCRLEFLKQVKYAWKSAVNPLNRWCAKLRDMLELWVYPIYMTKDIHSSYSSNRFKRFSSIGVDWQCLSTIRVPVK